MEKDSAVIVLVMTAILLFTVGAIVLTTQHGWPVWLPVVPVAVFLATLWFCALVEACRALRRK